MVPVKTSRGGNLISDIYQLLAGRVRQIDVNTIEGAFSVWMCSEEMPPFQERTSSFVVSNYSDVAALAFLTENDPQKFAQESGTLADGLRRVAGRSITQLEGRPASFRYDALALLGLALGARRIGGEVQQLVGDWLGSFVKPAEDTMAGWKRVLFYAALRFAGQPTDERDLEQIPDCEDIKLALASKGGDFFTTIDMDIAYQQVCGRSIIDQPTPVIDACRYTALHYLGTKLPTISLNKPSVEQVVDLLNNIPRGMKRWTWEDNAKTKKSSPQKWDLQNEYHVQSLVFFLLAPIFPDIESEFYLETLGQINPRADIGLPSLNLIIEIKFLRPGISFTSMIEEVAADASLYFTKDNVYKKKYSQMIVLLWDNSARNQEHHTFKANVTKIQNIIGAVVVSRPGNMPIQIKVDARSANEGA